MLLWCCARAASLNIPVRQEIFCVAPQHHDPRPGADD